MSDEFVREERYIVFKIGDVENAFGDIDKNMLHALEAKIHNYRCDIGKRPVDCVVVESDWPEFEPTWAAIEKRMVGE